MDQQTYKKIRIFVAHTSELTAEIEKVREVVNELNKSIGDALGVFLEVVEWKTHVMSMMGRPQQVIFDQLPVNSWDIFIGILWLRFGSPPGATNLLTGEPYRSGIEEEFTLAYDLWRNTGRPQVLFFRCTHPTSPSTIDPDELRKINQFFSSFNHSGTHPGLINTYDTVEAFAQKIQTDLIRILLSYGDQEKLKVLSIAGDKNAEILRIPVEDGFVGFFVPRTNEERNARKRNVLARENRLVRLMAQTGFSYLAKVGHRFKSQLIDCLNSGASVQVILLNPWTETGFMIAFAESDIENTKTSSFSNEVDFSQIDVLSIIEQSVYYNQKFCQIGDEYKSLSAQFGDRINIRITTHDMPATVLLTSTAGFFEPYLSINLRSRLTHYMNTFEVQFGIDSYFYRNASSFFDRMWQISENYEDFLGNQDIYREHLKSSLQCNES
jgi:hypothetical protein